MANLLRPDVIRKFYIYILYDNLLGRYFYIGSSTNPNKRLIRHTATYGATVSMEILQIIYTTKRKVHKSESYWINQFYFWGVKVLNIMGHTTIGRNGTDKRRSKYTGERVVPLNIPV